MQNWEQWLIHQGVVLPFRETLTFCRNGPTGISSSSAKRNAKSCSCKGSNKHVHQYTLVTEPLETSFVGKDSVALLNKNAMLHCRKGQPSPILHCQQAKGADSWPLLGTLKDLSAVLFPVPGSTEREMDLLERAQWRAITMIEGLESLTSKRSWKCWHSSAWRKEYKGEKS